MSRRQDIKILIVAPNASSRFGGEAFLPLKYFQILRRRGLPAKLIAHARNRADLSETLAPFLSDVSFVEDTVWHRSIWKLGRPFPRRVREAIFGTLMGLINSHFQARLIRHLVRQGEVDLIHEPIPVSPLAPSAIYGYGVPVVIGPMNGGMTFPPGYENFESRSTRWFIHLARAMARLANRIVPGKLRATALIVANARSRAALPFADHPNVIELVENGVDLSAWVAAPRPRRAADAPFRLVFMGRLVDWKAVDVTLTALARCLAQGTVATLDILGDGTERPRLEAMVSALGLTNSVRFLGFQPQSVCATLVSQSDALILNSVWECGGAVVLEAMSLGLPIIATDWGGPADYLDATCGILVSPVPRAGFADRLAEAIGRLAADPMLCQRLGIAGTAKVREEYDWEKKVDRMLEIYGQAVRN